MHKYNNQDHSMMTALLAARNILGLGSFDTWKVNTDCSGRPEPRTPMVDGSALTKRIAAGSALSIVLAIVTRKPA